MALILVDHGITDEGVELDLLLAEQIGQVLLVGQRVQHDLELLGGG